MESVIEPVVGTGEVSEAGRKSYQRKNTFEPGNRKQSKGHLSSKRVSTLEAMQWVVSKKASEDKSIQHKEFRKALNEDRKGFMATLVKLESEEKADRKELESRKRSERGEVEELPTDFVDEEKLAGVIERLLSAAKGGGDGGGNEAMDHPGAG